MLHNFIKITMRDRKIKESVQDDPHFIIERTFE